MERKFGALSSSEDPSKLAATVTGFMQVAAGVLVTLGVLTQVDMNTLMEQIVVIVPAGYAVYGAVNTVFGLVRKIVIALQARFS